MNAQEIRELFKRHDVPLSREDVWEVRGNPVIKHQALERLSDALEIKWLEPKMLRSERDEAVILVTGIRGQFSEWSIGEAAIGQSYQVTGRQAAFPYAMAEKRAKDRVILKLAGVYGSHSEEEMKQQPEQEEAKSEEQQPERPVPASAQGVIAGVAASHSRAVYIERALKRMNDFESASELLKWAKTEREMVWPQYGIQAHDVDGQTFVHAYMQRKAALESSEEAA